MNNNKESKAISVIESILFSSDRPIPFDVLKSAVCSVDSSLDTKQLIEKYNLNLQQTERGIFLDNIAGKYQLRTKKDNSEILRNINKAKQFKLSTQAMEALAVIAYEGPCIKARVDEVRSVDSSHLIKVLMDKGLVAFGGKSDLPGKPMLYKTTNKFLEVFGLNNIKNLPSLEEVEELVPEGTETLSDLNFRMENTEDKNIQNDLDQIGNTLSKIKVPKINKDVLDSD